MFSMQIPVDKIKDVIGKGGKVIQELCATCNCKIDVEEDGRVFISAIDADDARAPSAPSRPLWRTQRSAPSTRAASPA